MKSFTDQAIVLKKTNFGEADRLLILFTKNHGKITVLAKGVRRPKSRKGGNLDLLNHVEVFVTKGRNLDLVLEAKTLNSFFPLKKELKLVAKAYYLCELVDGLCALEQSLPFVFDLLLKTLSQFLSQTNARLWDFEFELLQHLGFMTPEQRPKKRGLRSYVEEIIERELKTPKFYRAVFPALNTP